MLPIPRLLLRRGLPVVWLLVVCPAAGTSQAAGEQAGASPPLLEHIERSLTGDESQWRTPNPDFEAGGDGPSEFGLRFRMEPDGRHATGELTGLYEDGRQVLYWSLLTFYNPVTERVIAQQIGWDGSLVRGEMPVQPGERQVLDATTYAASGAMKRTRHVTHFIEADVKKSDVYEYGPDGEWQLRRQWRWRRHPTPGARRVEDAPSPSSARRSKLEPHVGHLLSGSGQWRAANPGWLQGSDAPREFGMNYRWGPHRQHVIAEIVSLYADGRREKDWSLYLTYNPVTGVATAEQTGWPGLYFRGETSVAPDGHHVESGLIFFPNGTVKSVRDENEMVDPDTRIARVFERAEDGGWRQVREWTWKQLPAD